MKRATRGLYGAARKDVLNELEQDIFERVRVSRAFGLSETQALNRALEQLGDPRAVSVGMANTYMWPRALKGLSLLCVMGLVFLFYPLAPARGQDLTGAEWYGVKLEGAQWAADGLFDRYMAPTIQGAAVLQGQRLDLAGRVIVAVTVTPSTSVQPLSYYVDKGQQEVRCDRIQPNAGAYTAITKADPSGRFELLVLSGVLAQQPTRWLPRSIQEACTPRVVNTGVYLAVFAGGSFTPLKTRLAPGTRLEPGKTYTL